MKKVYTFFLLTTLNFSFAQDPQLFNVTWYLHNVIIDGVNNIPPNPNMYLSFDSPTSFSAKACNTYGFQVAFPNNNTQFSVQWWSMSLEICQDQAAGNYQNIYIPVFLEGFSFNSATNQLLTYSISEFEGVKTLIINSAFNKQAIYKTVALSTQQFNKESFTFYPNPSEDFIDINLIDNYLNDATLEIYNEIGILFKREKISLNSSRIDINNLPNGLYFIKISTEQGSTVKKLIKK